MKLDDIYIRIAQQEDLTAIVTIYNSTVASRLVTADTEPVSVTSRQAWFDAHTANRPLWCVWQENAIVAWISFQNFYGRPAYDRTAELSIYISIDMRGKGLGNKLLAYAMAEAPAYDIDNILAFIFSHNTPSIQLFKKWGFETWGQLPNVAIMDGNHYSLSILGKALKK